MALFRDSDHLYGVFDGLFRRLAARRDVAEALSRAGIVLELRYSDPDAKVTVDLRRPELSWQLGESALTPDLTLIQSGDTAHAFWLGRLSIPGAIATRRVVARGPVGKALKLLPALAPAYALYADVLRERGETALLTALDRPSRPRPLRQALSRLVGGIKRRLVPAAPPEREDLPPLPFPLEDDPGDPEPRFRDQGLPASPEGLRRAMLERMALIRAFERRLSRGYADGKIPTEAIHVSIGQEAVAVGVAFALRADDVIATTHRGHGHMLAKGADLDGMMAEILGRASGLCGGKGGSMHVTDAAVGAFGANGIVGASPLIAAGAAHASRLARSDRVAVAFLGDGATNQGMFHEAVNFAAVLDLPAVFVIENNLYGEFTPLARHCRVSALAERAAAYGIPGVQVDGNDPWAVLEATRAAVARARSGGGPTLLECLTYRWHGHMEGEKVPYRSPEEVASWQERCPIRRLGEALERSGALGNGGAAEVERAAEARVEESFARALAAPEPDLAALATDVFAPEPRALYAAPAKGPAAGVRTITCAEALREAIAEEMERDPRVYLLGEDVTTGGYFAMTTGLVERFGKERVVDTPISEYAIVGSAVGAAMAGARPVAEILFSDFLTTCMDPLVNQAAKLRYMSGGQYRLPLVVRTPGGAGLGMAAQHSQSLEALLTGIPGLIVLAPATPADCKGMLKAAIRSSNPVLFFENKVLYAESGPVPEGDVTVPLGVAEVKRRGTDLTLVSVGAVLGRALEAAESLAQEGIEVEVVDVRTLVPLDLATILASVRRTGRLLTLEDGVVFHGFGAEVVSQVSERAHRALRCAPRRLGGLAVPIPYSSKLENAAIPGADQVRAAARALIQWRY